MQDEEKTRAQLITELHELRERLAEAERDKSEHNEVERVLRDSRQMLETVINHMPASVALIGGHDLRLRLVNPGYQAIAPGKEMVGKTLDELWPETGRNFTEICSRVLNTGEAHQVQDEMNMIQRQADGPLEQAYFSWSLHRVRLAGEEGWGLLNASWETTERKRAEVALQVERDQLAALIRNIRDEIWYANSGGQFVHVNPSASREFSLESGAATDVRQLAASLEVFRPDGTPRPLEEAPPLRALRGEVVTNQEEVIRTPATGELRYRQVSAAPVRNESGRITGSVAVARDITEFKRAEEALRQSEHRFRQVVESLPQLVWTCVADGPCDYLSPQWVRYTGKSEAEQLGYGWLQQLHPDDRRRAIEQWQATLAIDKDFEIEFRIRRHDGTYRWFRTLAVRLRDEAGNVVKWFGSNTDIDDIKRAEEATRESEERLRLHRERMPIGCIVYDDEFRFVELNPAAERIFGYRAEELIGLHAQVIVPPDSQPHVEGLLHRLAAGEMTAHSVNENLTRDNRIIICDWLNTPLRDSRGGFLGFLSMVQDVTEYKKAEEVLQESETRSRLLSKTAARLLKAEDPLRIVSDLGAQVMAHLDCQAFFNFVVDEAEGRLRLNAWAGIPEEEARRIEWLDYGVAVCGCVAQDGVRIIAEDICSIADPRTELVKSYGIQAYACHPLMAGGRIIGTLSFGTKTRSRFSRKDLDLMKTVADQVAVAMERMRLIAELEDARDKLEVRVRSRTAELLEVNEALKIEIIERKRSEEALKNERQRFNDVLDMLPTYVVLLDADYHVPFMNRYFRERYGESGGRRCFEWLFNRTEPCENCQSYTVFKTNAPHHWEWTDPVGRKYDVFDFPFTDTDGSPLIMEVGIDVTELRQAEMALRCSEESLRKHAETLQQIVDGISDPIILLDKDGLVQTLNKAATDYHGVCEDMDVLGKPCYQGLRRRETACVECEYPFLSAETGTMSFERKGFRDPGRVENVTVYPVLDVHGRRDAVIIKISDITKAKILERQILQNEKLASLGLVTSGIAHEINNPNSFIYFNLPILRRYLEELLPIVDEYAALHPEFEVLHMSYGELKEDIFKLLGNMQHGTQRISKTIEVLKSFVRKRGTEGIQQVDLKEILDKVVALCQTELSHKVGSFEFIVPEDLPPLFSDPEALEQVFLNLLINAIHACDKPDSRVCLKVEHGLPDGKVLLIEVSDNGSGIEETVREKIFDPFFTTKSSTEGTGLGLYLCHSHVESLGGRIEVESSPGLGATFRVLLPLASERPFCTKTLF